MTAPRWRANPLSDGEKLRSPPFAEFERSHDGACQSMITPNCVDDLAKGLSDYMEAESNLVGPLMKDYQFVASGLLDAYQIASGS